jgi:hypothetical protein
MRVSRFIRHHACITVQRMTIPDPVAARLVAPQIRHVLRAVGGRPIRRLQGSGPAGRPLHVDVPLASLSADQILDNGAKRGIVPPRMGSGHVLVEQRQEFPSRGLVAQGVEEDRAPDDTPVT